MKTANLNICIRLVAVMVFISGWLLMSSTVFAQCPFQPTFTSSTVTSNCGGPQTITVNGPLTTAGGEVWYWQTSSTGTSTSSPLFINGGSTSVHTYTAMSSGTYYVRAFKNSCWSSSSYQTPAVVVTNTPVQPTSSGNACGNVTLSLSAGPTDGSTWYWQGLSPSGSTANNAAINPTFTASSTGTYYIGAKQGTCWVYNSIAVTVNALPLAPSGVATSFSTSCGPGVLTITSGAPNTAINDGWYWQTSNTGTTISSGNAWYTNSYSVSTSGTYYLRTYNSTRGCWSDPASSFAVAVTVNPSPNIPATPTGTSPICGSTLITYTGAPSDGSTWYWQGTTPNGNTSNNALTNTTYQVNASGTYYLGAKLGSCWQYSSISMTIKPLPLGPSGLTTVVSNESCGNKTISITSGAPNTANNDGWYWQTSNTNTSTSNAWFSGAYTVTNSQTYYLRTYNSVTQCWSDPSFSYNQVVSINPLPAAPPAPTAPASASCIATITRSGTVPPGETWYWQGSSSTSSVTNLGSGPTFTVNNINRLSGPTMYYIRSVSAMGCWGPPSGVTVSPSAQAIVISPTNPTICYNSTASFSVTGSCITGVVWRDGQTQDILAQSAYFVTPRLVSSRTFFYFVYDNQGLLANGSVFVNVAPEVTLRPAKPFISLTLGGAYQLNSNNPNTATNQFFWQNSSDGISTTTYPDPRAIPSGGTYFIRISDNNGCWGPSTSIDVPDFSTPSYGQAVDPNNQNFVRSFTYLTKDALADPNSLSPTQVTTATQYIDGLGRPYQSVGKQSSPMQKDIVSASYFDAFGRSPKSLLPYVSTTSTGAAQPTAFGDQYAFYQLANTKVPASTKPFSYTLFDGSPLNQSRETAAPGDSWVGTAGTVGAHSTREIIAVNQANEVALYIYSPVNALVTNGGYYGAGQLVIKKSTDEQGNDILEYSDKQGRVVCKKVQYGINAGVKQYTSTYYIYDDVGMLSVVIPPEASSKMGTEYFGAGATSTTQDNFLKRWAFRYAYDARKRMIQKQVPGADPVYMVYDKLDRLVLTQDGNQRAASTKYWSFTKYDLFSRPILTGIKDTTAALTQSQMQAVIDNYYLKPGSKYGETFVGTAAGNIHGYSNKAYPVQTSNLVTSLDQFTTVNFYDDYSFKALYYDSASYSFSAAELPGEQIGNSFKKLKGKMTGQMTKVMDGTSPMGGYTWLKSVVYYDNKFRQVQTVTDNYKGGTDRITTVYDFAGRVLKTKTNQVTMDVTWTDKVNVAVAGNVIKKSLNTNDWGSAGGAASLEFLPAGQDGWVEFTTGPQDTYFMLGLSDVNPDAHYAHIDYAVYNALNVAQVYENNVNKAGSAGALWVGTVFRIERVAGVIYYKRNGVTFYTSGVPSTTNLIVDFSIYNYNGPINNVRTSFSRKQNITIHRFEYDHASRLVKTWHQTNANPEVLLAANEYNELGQLVTKKLHAAAEPLLGQETTNYSPGSLVVSQYNGERALVGKTSVTLASGFYVPTGSTLTVRPEQTWNAGNVNPPNASFAQVVDYRYNIRGWLTKVNESDVTVAPGGDPRDYFGMELLYDQADAGIGNTAAFNGNISAMKWSKNQSLGITKENSYAYTYDPLSRITGANFKEKATSWSVAANSGFSETGYTYDLNGNILSLVRYDKRGAPSPMDNLVYDYGLPGVNGTTSNKLLGVADSGDKTLGFIDGSNASPDYTYDANGNMITDQNKGISSNITYNVMNLPELITRGGNSVQYIYDATGRNVSQVASFSGTQKQTDYDGEFVYENNLLQFVNTEEGRVVMADTKLIYTNACSDPGDMVASNATLTSVTQNGTEKYVKAVSNGTTALTGMFPIGGIFQVAAGERYRIRAKGYRDKGTAASSSNAYLLIKADAAYLGWPGASLPASSTTATTESWIEQIVTIPAGATGLQVGMVWNTVQTGEAFYLNDFEITKINANNWPEYQYHLKDHLGNVRTTFTMKNTAEATKATVETANLSKESTQFLNISRARRVNARIYDHTYDGQTPPVAGAFAVRLTGSVNEKIGLAKSISVMPGDKVDIEVFGKYLDPSATNDAALVSALGAIAAGTASAGTVIDGAGYSTAGSASYPFTGFLNHNDNGTGPKAYLNYLIFDRNFVYQTGGFKRLSTNAKETGDILNHTGLNYEGIPHERLAFDGVDQLQITQPGYVYIWLSNEELNPVEVYFDDFKVTQTKSPVIQQDDYYPFGLTFNSYIRESSVLQNLKFGNKEQLCELGLAWLDFGARNYIPELGRWTSIDPYLERMANFSAYSYSFNNPILLIDPSGMLPRYNWGSQTYENEDGETISWQEAYASIKNEQKRGNGPNTRNAMVFMNSGRQMLAMAQSNSLNTNWHYYNASGMLDAADHVSEYSNLVGKLLNLVVRSHGAVASIGLGLSESSTSCVNGECFNRDDASSIIAGFEPNNPEADMASLNTLKSFAGSMAAGGNLIFTACNAGDYGGALGININKLFKMAGLSINFNMYFNGDKSRLVKISPNGQETILDSSLTPKNEFRDGWYMIAPNGEATQIKKSIQLNSRGVPVTFVDPN